MSNLQFVLFKRKTTHWHCNKQKYDWLKNMSKIVLSSVKCHLPISAVHETLHQNVCRGKTFRVNMFFYECQDPLNNYLSKLQICTFVM